MYRREQVFRLSRPPCNVTTVHEAPDEEHKSQPTYCECDVNGEGVGILPRMWLVERNLVGVALHNNKDRGDREAKH